MRLPQIFGRLAQTDEHATLKLLDILLYIGLGAILAISAFSILPDITNLISGATVGVPRRDAMGQFGDFVGGTLNPFLTFLAFIALLVTLVLQQTELRESRTQFENSATALTSQHLAMRDQIFDSSFFQMLATHNAIVDSLRIEDPITHEIALGRDAFRVVYSNLRRAYRAKQDRFKNTKPEAALIALSYQEVYRDHQLDLAHYFRFLYNTFRHLKDNEKERPYIQILRAQLSNQELLVLYYNCTVGRHGRKFKTMAEDVELFDNMPDRLLNNSHAGSIWIDPRAFGPDGYAGSSPRDYLLGDLSNAPTTNEEMLERRSGI